MCYGKTHPFIRKRYETAPAVLYQRLCVCRRLSETKKKVDWEEELRKYKQGQAQCPQYSKWGDVAVFDENHLLSSSPKTASTATSSTRMFSDSEDSLLLKEKEGIYITLITSEQK